MKTTKNLTLKGLTFSEAKEDEARETLERLRWGDAVACPRCGSMEVSKIEPKAAKKIRKGLYRCRDCRKNKTSNQFTVTVGTIFEDSHIPLYIWLQAISLLCASKKGMSAHQLHRQLGIMYKSAWFMAHRIRYAMQQKITKRRMKGVIEADETWVGGKSRRIGQQTGWENKTPVVALVQRNGKVRSFVVPTVTASTLKETLLANVHPKSHLVTDELDGYKKIGKEFASHQTVKHGDYEYVRGDVTTNTVEGYFGLLKRGINGVYHHVSKEHLHRYLAEFDFRYNHRKTNDHKRTVSAIMSTEGKRLTYRDSLS
ncbi:MAG TPA: IS1595 family transposase [Bacteroidota bacterium]